MAVGTPPGVAANTNPGASNPAEIALEISHLDIGTDIGKDAGRAIGVEVGTGSGAADGTTEGSG